MNATVTFKDLLTNKILATGVKVTPVSSSDTKTGTANTVVTLSTGQYGAQEYLIEVTLGGSYKNTQQLPAPYGTATVGSPAVQRRSPDRHGDDPQHAQHDAGSRQPPKLTTAAGTYGDASTCQLRRRPQVQQQRHEPSGTDPPDPAAGRWHLLRQVELDHVASRSPGRRTRRVGRHGVHEGKHLQGQLVWSSDEHRRRCHPEDGRARWLHTANRCSSGDTIGFTVLSTKTSSLYYSNNWVFDSSTLSWKTMKQGVGTGTGVVDRPLRAAIATPFQRPSP